MRILLARARRLTAAMTPVPMLAQAAPGNKTTTLSVEAVVKQIEQLIRVSR
jgi:hypothetical protein